MPTIAEIAKAICCPAGCGWTEDECEAMMPTRDYAEQAAAVAKLYVTSARTEAQAAAERFIEGKHDNEIHARIMQMYPNVEFVTLGERYTTFDVQDAMRARKAREAGQCQQQNK